MDVAEVQEKLSRITKAVTEANVEFIKSTERLKTAQTECTQIMEQLYAVFGISSIDEAKSLLVEKFVELRDLMREAEEKLRA